MIVRIDYSWYVPLKEQFEAPYFARLKDFLVAEREQYTCYPPGSKIFAAFDATPFDKVKVVILGQDPYHEPGQAMGLSFSVPQGVMPPPSLKNIITELNDDLGLAVPDTCGDLTSWAQQGVLLLNSTLTVRAHRAGSHQRQGWETFTDAAIEALGRSRRGIVFMFWGSYAQAKRRLLNPSHHCVLTAPHPSPLSAYRGFFGCRHFSRANDYMRQHGQEPVDWGSIGR